MKQIKILVSKEIKANVQLLYEILNAEKDYISWWPFRIKHIRQGALEFSPLPFVTIRIEKKDFIPHQEIGFAYTNGPFRGKGTWLLRAIDTTRTLVSYQIALTPINRVIAWLASSESFEIKHRKDIEAILLALERKILRCD